MLNQTITEPHPPFSIHNMVSIHYSDRRCTFLVLQRSTHDFFGQHLTDRIEPDAYNSGTTEGKTQVHNENVTSTELFN